MCFEPDGCRADRWALAAAALAALLTGCMPEGGGGGDDPALGDAAIELETDAAEVPTPPMFAAPDAGAAPAPVEVAEPEPEPLPEPDFDPEPEPAPEPEPEPAPDPLPSPDDARTPAAVCAHWRAERRAIDEGWQPTGDGGECDPGRISDAAQANAVRRANLYRWLAGVEPVALAADRVDGQQACAVIQAARRRLDHQPGPDAPCYTAAGAEGAGSSNLAGGAGVADSVDLYVGDRGVPSLGHRRWVLNPAAEETAFGWKAAYSCMYSFSQGRRHDVAVVAWPPPGPVPDAVVEGRFSVQLYGVTPGDDFTIEVGVDGEAPAPIAYEALPIGFGGRAPAFAFEPGVDWRAGHTVEVVLDGLADAEAVRYSVEFVDCD